MDELGNLLRGEHNAHREAAPGPDPQVFAHVRGAVRRRRAVRSVAASALAFVAVGAVGVGVWGLGGDNGTHQLEPMESVEPSPTPTEPFSPEITSPPVEPDEVEPKLEFTKEPEPAVPPIDDSPDGIPEGQYPPLAADRGDFTNEFGEVTRYPKAHQIEDWVWERVGPGWTINSVSKARDYLGVEAQPAAVLYLVSPENYYFDLGSPPEETWGDVRAVSWHERAHTVRLAWLTPDGHDAAGLYDLRTGELDKLQTNVYGERATSHTFIAGNARGDELWAAHSPAGTKFYRWTAQKGWHASDVVDKAPDADYLDLSPGYQRPTVSADNNRVLLSPNFENFFDGSTLTMVDYTLDADRVTLHTFDIPQGFDDVYDFVVTKRGTALAKALTYEDDNEATLEFTLDGSGSVSVVSEGYVMPKRAEYDVAYGQASSPIIGAIPCGC